MGPVRRAQRDRRPGQAGGGAYDELSPGGFLIVDDWGVAPNCREAVQDFRAERGVNEEIVETDWTDVFWRKTA